MLKVAHLRDYLILTRLHKPHTHISHQNTLIYYYYFKHTPYHNKH